MPTIRNPHPASDSQDSSRTSQMRNAYWGVAIDRAAAYSIGASLAMGLLGVAIIYYVLLKTLPSGKKLHGKTIYAKPPSKKKVRKEDIMSRSSSSISVELESPE